MSWMPLPNPPEADDANARLTATAPALLEFAKRYVAWRDTMDDRLGLTSAMLRNDAKKLIAQADGGG